MHIVKLITVAAAAALMLGTAGASLAQAVTAGTPAAPAGAATGTVRSGSNVGVDGSVKSGVTVTPGAESVGTGVNASTSTTMTHPTAPATASTGVNASVGAKPAAKPSTAARTDAEAEAERKAAANPDGHDVAPALKP